MAMWGPQGDLGSTLDALGSIFEALGRTFGALCSTLGAPRSTLDHFWVPRVQIGGNAEDFGGLSCTLEALISTVGGPRRAFVKTKLYNYCVVSTCNLS